MPQKPPTPVIYITIIIDGKERVIPVNMPQPNEGYSDELIVHESVPTPRLLGSKVEAQPTLVQRRAKSQAMLQANKDRNTLNVQSGSNLRKIAENNAYECIQDKDIERYLYENNRDQDDAIGEYVDEFISVYEEKTGGVLDDATYIIQQKVFYELSLSNAKGLYPGQIEVLAYLSVADMVPRSNNLSQDLNKVSQFATIYKNLFIEQNNAAQKGGSGNNQGNFSGPFRPGPTLE